MTTSISAEGQESPGPQQRSPDPQSGDNVGRSRLAEHHLVQLAASGITAEHAALRGYETIRDPRRLAEIGIPKAGQRTQGLLVPQLRVDGSTWGYQYRPDHPRERGGKIARYETPIGQRNGIDIPPGVAPRLGNPAVPLFITEGVKKADSGALQGLCIVDVPGVWSWKGKPHPGASCTVAVADWHDIALNGRRVILAFDGDIARKPAVQKANRELAGYLKSKGAKVEYLHLPDTDKKTGIDDYLMDGHTVEDLWRLVKPEPRDGSTGSTGSGCSSREATEPVTGTAGLNGSTGSAGSNGEATEPVTEPLTKVRAWLARFIYPMAERDLDLLALWIAHTHLVHETYTTPRLLIESPVPESGKTTVLEHLERLCVKPVQMANVSSPAMITRLLNADMRTILIDEADRSLDPDKPGIGDLIAVLNSGYKKGATRPVNVSNAKGNGWTVAEMPTFAPVAMAGNQPRLPDDTMSRVIRVLIMPDHEGKVEDSDWELIEAEAKNIASDLARWADSVREDVKTGERPTLHPDAKARTKERWLPLKRVAAAAGGRWPEVVDHLVELDLERMRLEREEGIINEKPHVKLLRHIKAVWPKGEAFLPTDDIITRLSELYPSSWGPSEKYPNGLTAQRFGRMLVKNYGVFSGRTSDHVRGYFASAFTSALRSVRLDPLIEPAEPSEPTQSAETGTEPADGDTGDGVDELFVAGTSKSGSCADCGKRPPILGQIRCATCNAVHERVMAGYDR
jgi:hypothetical protein